MFFQAVLVSLIAILIGLALTLSGYRFFIILLPIWGFFAGFSATGTTIRGLWGTGFFNTVFSWVIGLLVGLLFAVLAYLFYYAAIIILGATVGYMLGIGFMTWIGFQLGFISLMVGLILAVIFAFGVWYLKVPKLLIIILTSLAGAASLLAVSSWRLGRFHSPTCSGARWALLCDNPGGGRSFIWRSPALASRPSG